MAAEIKVCTSPFCNFEKKKLKGVGSDEYSHVKLVEKIQSGFDPKKPDQFLIDTTVEEYERVPIVEYINSFDSSVGLKNLLKGIISKSQMDAFIEEHQAPNIDIDATLLPSSPLAFEKLAGSVDSYWDDIPAELKGNMTKDEFMKTITADMIKSYVDNQIKAQQQVQEGGNE